MHISSLNDCTHLLCTNVCISTVVSLNKMKVFFLSYGGMYIRSYYPNGTLSLIELIATLFFIIGYEEDNIWVANCTVEDG